MKFNLKLEIISLNYILSLYTFSGPQLANYTKDKKQCYGHVFFKENFDSFDTISHLLSSVKNDFMRN